MGCLLSLFHKNKKKIKSTNKISHTQQYVTVFKIRKKKNKINEDFSPAKPKAQQRQHWFKTKKKKRQKTQQTFQDIFIIKIMAKGGVLLHKLKRDSNS